MPGMKKGKRFNFNPTITTRITIIYGSVFTVVIFIASFILLTNAFFFYSNLRRTELMETADKVSEFIESGMELTDEALRTMVPSKSVEIRVINLKSHIEQNTTELEDQLPPRPPKEAGEYKFKGGNSRDAMFKFAMSYRFSAYERIMTYDEQDFLIQVSRPFTNERGMFRLFILAFAIFNILGSMVAFFISKYIAKRTLQPITRITQAAERISIEDLSRRIDVAGPDDEIKELAVTFNDMIERLETSFKQQNQFLSDASHELRTPISVIQGYANLIDRWGKEDPAILQESIDSIKAETQHMSMLVKKLLFLAKGDQLKKQVHLEPLSLRDIAAEVLREANLREEAGEQAPLITLMDESPAVIEGDYDLVKQMLWIFVENSVKYGGDALKEIRLRTFAEGERACISVEDQGIGIPEEDLPFIFERFYRGDKSRSKEIPGTGLGLSIADWIIKQHGAQVVVKSQVGCGTNITVKFKVKAGNGTDYASGSQPARKHTE